MDVGFVVLALVVAPVLGAALCLALGRGRLISVAVAVTAGILMLLSLVLLLEVRASGASSVDVSGSGLGWASLVVTGLDFALMAFFVYTGFRLRNNYVIAFGLLQLVPLGVLEAYVGGRETEPLFVVDYLAIVMALVVNIVGSIICIYGTKYMEKDRAQPRFFMFMLLFLGAMNGAVFANNLLWLFFFWEVTTLCSYFLIGHENTVEAKASATKALVYTLGGGVAFAFGIILVDHYYGTLSLASILQGNVLGGIALMPFAFMAIAGFTKSAQAPFQGWLLGAMVAPTPVSALLHSSTMVKLGVYLLIRMSPAIGSSVPLAWTVAVLGGFSFLGTSILALAEPNAKRVLAYSTIGNLGLITMCVGINTSLAISAALILLLFHAVSKALLFMCVGVVKHETSDVTIDSMAGLRDRMPFVSLAFAIGVFTIMLPPFGMFASKWLISEAATSLPLLVFLLATGFAATVVYYTKWLGRVLSAGPEARRPSPMRDRLSGVFRGTLGSLVLAAVILSFLISLVIKYLVNPYVTLRFGPSIGGGTTIFNTFGQFPIVVLLFVICAMFVLAILLARPRKRDVAPPYTGGESYQFETGGFYLMSDLAKVRVNSMMSLVAVAILGALVLVPVALEVGTRF